MPQLTVCIPTAGQGTRMGAYCDHLNKALLPINKKAIISHIIEKFPSDTEFVIALGHRAEQVQTYLTMAHPNHKFQFVTVANYDGPGSGPGLTLLSCREHLQKPFFFVACDTLWQGATHLPTDCDWFGVSEVTPEESTSYCNFEIDTNDRIVGIRDKERVCGDNFRAFIGLCFVKNFQLFWQSLTESKLIKGEHQVSNGIRALTNGASARAVTVHWIDTGDAKKYEAAVRQYENFDFSKFNEALYIVDGRVIKYFADEKSAQKRVEKSRLNPTVFPEVSNSFAGFYSYNLMPGRTLYEHCTPALFRRLLYWMDRELWRTVPIELEKFKNCCEIFYRKKTTERINLYLSKNNPTDEGLIVNGMPVAPVHKLLAKVPWHWLCEGRPTFFHGDLQFDNILHDPTTDRFTLLDWRQDFAGEISFGDLYYDLAKMLGGQILNYDYIKSNMFSYIEENNSIFFDYAQRIQGKSYSTILKEFALQKGLDWSKVELLVPIIFLNMSPLHHFPFNKLLFALGCKMLEDELVQLEQHPVQCRNELNSIEHPNPHMS